MTQFHIAGRRTGRTTMLINWVLRGHRIVGAPYWSRVIVSGNLPPKFYVTGYPVLAAEFEKRAGFTLDSVVFAVQELDRLRGTAPEVEIGADDLEGVLRDLFGMHSLAVATMEGNDFDEHASIQVDTEARRQREHAKAPVLAPGPEIWRTS